MLSAAVPHTRVSEGASYFAQRQPHIIILIIAIEAFLPTQIESFLPVSLWWLPDIIANEVTSDTGIDWGSPFRGQVHFASTPRQPRPCIKEGIWPSSLPFLSEGKKNVLF